MPDGVSDPALPQLCSVVIPAYNAADTLPVQLAALADQAYEGAWEVVVVDNNSVDGSAAVTQRFTDALPSLRVVQAWERQGINYARNAGAGAAKGDLILFCDADDIVQPGWLAAMAKAGAGCDLVGGRVDEESLNAPDVRAWRPPQPADRLPTALGFLPYAIGANCGVRRTVIEQLGGFNEAYARGAADVEFFWRGQLAGYRLGYVPDAVVQYRHRQGLKPLARQFYRFGMAEAQLYAAFRGDGVPPSSVPKALREWAWVLLRSTDALPWRPAQRRGAWVRKAAHRLGRLRGSLRYHVLFP